MSWLNNLDDPVHRAVKPKASAGGQHRRVSEIFAFTELVGDKTTRTLSSMMSNNPSRALGQSFLASSVKER